MAGSVIRAPWYERNSRYVWRTSHRAFTVYLKSDPAFEYLLDEFQRGGGSMNIIGDQGALRSRGARSFSELSSARKERLQRQVRGE